MQALLGGDVTGGIAATNAVIAAVLRGAPLVSVISTANRPYHRLWVQPEIRRFEDLRGKTLGVTRFGSVTDNLTRMILRKNGLENAVTVRQMGGTIEVSAAFQNRQIAGAVTSSLRVESNMQPRLLAKLEDMGIQYSMDVIAHSREDLKRSPQVVEGMARAYIEGVAAMHFQKERAYKAIAKFARLRTRKRSTRFIRIRSFTWKKHRASNLKQSTRFSNSWGKRMCRRKRLRTIRSSTSWSGRVSSTGFTSDSHHWFRE